MEKAKVRLNLACGNDYRKGYINIDNCSMFDCKVDLEADITTLEWDNNSVDEIVLSHFAMYLTPDNMRTMLNRFFKWLKKGGTLIIETADFQRLMEDYREIVELPYPDYIAKLDSFVLTNLFGSPKDANYNIPTSWSWYPDSLKKELCEAGFIIVSIKDGKKKPMRDFEITAIR